MGLSAYSFVIMGANLYGKNSLGNKLIDLDIPSAQIHLHASIEDFEKEIQASDPDSTIIFFDVSSCARVIPDGLISCLIDKGILIILADSTDQEIAMKAISQGAQDYIIKDDFDGHLLLKTIRLAIERCSIRHELAQVGEEYKLIFEQSPVPMWVYELETGKFLKVNTAAKAKYGYTDEEFNDLTIWDIRPAEDIERLKEVMENAQRSFPRHKGYWRHVKKNNGLIYVDITSHYIEFSGKEAVIVLAYDITDKVKTELKEKKMARMLRESNERYRLTSKVTQDAIWEYNFSSKVLTWGEGYNELFGYDHEVGKKVDFHAETYIHEDDKERVWESLIKAIQDPKVDVWNERYRYYRADGTVANVNNRAIIIRDKDRNAVRVVGALQDITGITEKEAQLEELNRKLKTAQKIAKIGTWTHNVASGRSNWSEEVYEVWGLDPDKFTPTFENVVATVHPEDRHIFLEELKTSFPEDEYHRTEHRIVTPEGNTKWIKERIRLHCDENGKPCYLEGTAQDITEEKEREQELMVSNERFKIAMRATHEAIWDWDISTDKILWSQGFETIFGYEIDPDKDTLSNTWKVHIHPDDKKKVLDSLETAVSDADKIIWREEYRFIKANGDYAYVHDRGFIIRNSKGKAIRAVGAVLDATESRNQINEIKLQNELLKEIAWNQSHLVRAPLARILGLINLLDLSTNGQPFNQEISDIFKYLRASSTELDQIVRDIVTKSTA